MPPFDQLIAQKLVAQPLFSTYLASNGSDTSVLILGGTDQSYYNGSINYVPFNLLQGLFGYWLITATDIKAGGTSLNNCFYCPLIVDTGTSILTGPPGYVEPLLSRHRHRQPRLHGSRPSSPPSPSHSTAST